MEPNATAILLVLCKPFDVADKCLHGCYYGLRMLFNKSSIRALIKRQAQLSPNCANDRHDQFVESPCMRDTIIRQIQEQGPVCLSKLVPLGNHSLPLRSSLIVV